MYVIKYLSWEQLQRVLKSRTLYLLQKGFLKLRNKKKAPKSLQAPRLESLTCTQLYNDLVLTNNKSCLEK